MLIKPDETLSSSKYLLLNGSLIAKLQCLVPQTLKQKPVLYIHVTSKQILLAYAFNSQPDANI
jgi:hypothetical protein